MSFYVNAEKLPFQHKIKSILQKVRENLPLMDGFEQMVQISTSLIFLFTETLAYGHHFLYFTVSSLLFFYAYY